MEGVNGLCNDYVHDQLQIKEKLIWHVIAIGIFLPHLKHY